MGIYISNKTNPLIYSTIKEMQKQGMTNLEIMNKLKISYVVYAKF